MLQVLVTVINNNYQSRIIRFCIAYLSTLETTPLGNIFYVHSQTLGASSVVCNINFDLFFAVQIAVQYVISERDFRTW